MKKKEWIYIIIVGCIFIFLVIGQYNKKEPINWKVTLANNDKQPFGTYASFELFKEMFRKDMKVSRLPVYNQLKESYTTSGSYIFIQQEFFIDKLDMEKLLEFVENGNSVFIAAEVFPKRFLDTLLVTNAKVDMARYYMKSSEDGGGDSTSVFQNVMEAGAPKEELSLAVKENEIYRMDKNHSLSYFKSFDLYHTTILGYSHKQGVADFIRVQYGKGFFYLNTNPVAFSNYYVLNKETNKYAFTALSYLPVDQPVVWDEYLKQGRVGENHILRELLSYPELKWAYYLALVEILAFVIFEGKRRQRVIPVYKPLANQTVDFVKVVGSLYYNKHNNTDIAMKRITYLLEYIRTHFYESTDNLNKEFIERLAEKTGCEKKFIQQMVETINKLKKQSDRDWMSNQDLITINDMIEEFYSKAKN
ncbi:MAG: DUF4350 domain-containing protein [Candidatus Azobacteroides sp.]|nr:DUF4350 domain-containing protein [Candidatus Azobacteroides sp.]